MGGVRFLSMSDAPKDVEAMRKLMPQASVVPLKAAPNRVGIADGTKVMGYDFVLVTYKDAKPEVVRSAIDVLAKDRAELGAALPHFKSLTNEQMAGVPNIFAFAGLISTVSSPAAAAEAKRLELLAGYSFMHDTFDGGTNFPVGWTAGMNYNLTPGLGIVGEIGGSHKSESFSEAGVGASADEIG